THWVHRSHEAEAQPTLNLDIGLPVSELSEPVRAAVNGESEIVDLRLPAVNRRGRSIDIDVRVAPLQRDGQAPDGVIVLVRRAGEPPEPTTPTRTGTLPPPPRD